MRELAEFIKSAESFALISHTSPDGDTLGSAAAHLYALKKMGKTAKWFCEGNIPEDYMKVEQIASLVQCTEVKKFDGVICIDAADIERLGACKELLKRFKSAQIDHHITNTHYADINVVKCRSANAFNVLELIKTLEVPLDENIARALFVGICTDTGRLSHNDVTALDVKQTAELYEHNLRQDEIIALLFQTTTMKKTKLKGKAIEHLESAFEGRVTYTYLDADDYACFNADSSHSEGIVEVCRAVEGTQIAFFIRQTNEGYKVSMRCKPEYNVSQICAVFGGGGHILASGCTIKDNRENVINLLLKEIEKVL